MANMTDNQKENFKERVRVARISMGATMDEFSEMINSRTNLHLNKSTISRWESGKQEPLLSTAGAVANALGLNILWLLGESDDKYENNSQKIDRIVNAPHDGSVLDFLVQLGLYKDEYLVTLISAYNNMPMDARVRLLSYALELERKEKDGAEE